MNGRAPARLSLAMLAGALALGAATPALGCSCIAESARAQFERADAVFTGRVMSVSSPSPAVAGGDPHGAFVTADFEVHQVYKHDVAASAAVRTQSQATACGVEFVAGETYLVFARTGGGVVETGVCDGTTDDLSVLSRTGARPLAPSTAATVTPPPPSEPSRAAPIVVAAGAAVLALAGLLARLRPG